MATYINGSAKAVQGSYGEFFNISFKLDDIKQYVNEKGYINITMSKRKEVGKYGETHSLTLNEYKPKENKENFSSEEELSIYSLTF